MNKHSHYYKKVYGEYIDVYRVLQLFEVTDPCLQHAVKKLLVAGGRGIKSIDKDVQEAIDSLARWQEMRIEEQNYTDQELYNNITATDFNLDDVVKLEFDETNSSISIEDTGQYKIKFT